MMKLMSSMFLTAIIGVSSLAISHSSIANTMVNQNALHKKVTVSQALKMSDDSKVELTGYVVRALGDEKYQFRDRTGTITVDIDDELWHGKAISAKTPVTILGEVDIDYKPLKRVEIDVDQVKFH